MKNILILFCALLACDVFAAWDGLPWDTTQYKDWSDTRTVGIVSQLVEGVQERCNVLPCYVEPFNIYDEWIVQVGTTNGLAVYTNVVTTNAMFFANGSYKLDISQWYSVPGFKAFGTNDPQYLALHFPIKKTWIDQIDAKLFEITPYFVQTNLMENGTFDDYFFGYTTNEDLFWPMHCKASVMTFANIGKVWGVSQEEGTAIPRRDYEVVVGGNAFFTRQPKKTNEKWTLWESTVGYNGTNIVWGPIKGVLVKTYSTPLTFFDRRYYDEDSYSFLQFHPSSIGTPMTNLTLLIELKGQGWTNSADFYTEEGGDQKTYTIEETVEMTIPNTATSSNVIVRTQHMWYYATGKSRITNSVPNGGSPLGASVTLGWTNWHSYANTNQSRYSGNPNQLFIFNLDERRKYISQLGATLGTEDYWSYGTSKSYGRDEVSIIDSNLLFRFNNEFGDGRNDFGLDGAGYFDLYDGLVTYRNLWGTEEVGYIPDPLIPTVFTNVPVPIVTNAFSFTDTYGCPYISWYFIQSGGRAQDYIWRTPAYLDIPDGNTVVLDPEAWYGTCGGPRNAFYGCGWVGAFGEDYGPDGAHWDSKYTQEFDYYGWFGYYFLFHDPSFSPPSGGYEYDIGTPLVDWIGGHEGPGGLPIEGNHRPNFFYYQYGQQEYNAVRVREYQHFTSICSLSGLPATPEPPRNLLPHKIQYYAGAPNDFRSPWFSYLHMWEEWNNEDIELQYFTNKWVTQSGRWTWDISLMTPQPTNYATIDSNNVSITTSDGSVAIHTDVGYWTDPEEVFGTNIINRCTTAETYVVYSVVTNFAIVYNEYDTNMLNWRVWLFDEGTTNWLYEDGQCLPVLAQPDFYERTQITYAEPIDFVANPTYDNGHGLSISTNVLHITNTIDSVCENFVATNYDDWASLPLKADAIANPTAYPMYEGSQFIDHITTNIVTYTFTNVYMMAYTNRPSCFTQKYLHYRDGVCWESDSNNWPYADGNYGWSVTNSGSYSEFWLGTPSRKEYEDELVGGIEWYFLYVYSTSDPYIEPKPDCDTMYYSYTYYDNASFDEAWDFAKSRPWEEIVVSNSVQSFVHTNYTVWITEPYNSHGQRLGTRSYHRETLNQGYGMTYQTEAVVQKVAPLFIWDFKRK